MNPIWPGEKLLDRRQLLRIGGLGALGLNLPLLFQAEAMGAVERAGKKPVKTIQSCILVFYYGGPSHLDTWDMKPHAPAEIRGEFKSIATRVPGIRISEHLSHSSRIMDKIAVIRSMRHPMRNHNSAAVEALCGRTPLRGDLELLADDPNSFPCYGSSLNYVMPKRAGIPTHVALPHVMYNVVVLPGQNAGFLGSSYNPFQIAQDPNAADFRVGELELPSDMTVGRLDDRAKILHMIDQQVSRQEKTEAAKESHYQRAFQLLRSDAVRRSFDLSREDEKTRQRYGRTKHGQSMLLARRLVEAGVRFVSVYDQVRNGLDNWDTHVRNFGRLKNDLLPPTDQAFAALVEDLHDRGMLDTTLVVGLGEFGRTPKINREGGRDHWPDCFSVALAGGGVQGGTLYGASDKIGAFPDADPVTPGDLAATMFWRFGIDPGVEVKDLTGRPYRLADGEPLGKLFS